MTKNQIPWLFIALLAIFSNLSNAQNIGINTTGASPNAASILDLNTGNSGTLGFLPEQVALTATNAALPLTLPPTGLFVYNTATAGVAPHNVVPGYYFNAGTMALPNWLLIAAANGVTPATGVWSIIGNGGTVDGTNFLGTTDNVPLNFKVDNQKSGRIDNALGSTFFGFQAGNVNSTGYYNTAIGMQALSANTVGFQITAIGGSALQSNTSGSSNTGVGAAALAQNTTGALNTAVGENALYTNVSGAANVAVGSNALFANTIGGENTACGYGALAAITTNSLSTAFGEDALNVSTGGSNTAVGGQACFAATTGSNLTACGFWAGKVETTGGNDTYIGENANPSAGGFSDAAAIGYNATVSASNNMVFGDGGVVGWGFGVSPGAAAIKVGTNGTNGNGASLTVGGVWTNGSDSTKKYDINPIQYGLSTVMKLRPVSYKMKGTGYRDIGFLAQEVKEVVPEIVYGKEGQMTLSYGQITAVLTKAVQEQQRIIDSAKLVISTLTQITQQQQESLGSTKKQLDELETRINVLEKTNQTHASIQESQGKEIAELKR